MQFKWQNLKNFGLFLWSSETRTDYKTSNVSRGSFQIHFQFVFAKMSEADQLRGQVIPGAIDGLKKSCTDLQQIAEWCKNAGETEQNAADVFRQTQGKKLVDL